MILNSMYIFFIKLRKIPTQKMTKEMISNDRMVLYIFELHNASQVRP